MAKTKRLDRKADLAAGTITFTDLSKTDKDGKHPSLTVAYREFPKEMQEKAVAHGWNAKLGDVAASADVDAIPTIKAQVEAIMAGNWGRTGSGGGPRTTILQEALFEALGVAAKAAKKPAPTMEQVEALLDNMSKEQRTAISKKPEVAAIKARIEEDRKREKREAAEKLAKESKGGADLLSLFADESAGKGKAA